MMRNICIKKALVVGIIVLFLGVGFQPAIANEISISIVSDVDGDCGCQPVSRVDFLRFKLLLIRIEAFTNIILSKFGHIPEIAERCQEILNIIQLNRLLDYPILCNILMAIAVPLSLGAIVFQLLGIYFWGVPFWDELFLMCQIIFDTAFEQVLALMDKFNC